MTKRVYISADYSEDDGDRVVVDMLNKWGSDNKHIVDFIDMAEVRSGSVSKELDCRPCDLKQEFNEQINSSSVVVFIVGDNTKYRMAGSSCTRESNNQRDSECTPYKQNRNGSVKCKIVATCDVGESKNVGTVNSWSYLRHEFEQAKKQKKEIIIFYNSLRNESNWLPEYMEGYESKAKSFWKINEYGMKVGDYNSVKAVLING